jgi:hypothetical protein
MSDAIKILNRAAAQRAANDATKKALIKGQSKKTVAAPRARVMVATPTYTGAVAHECAQSMTIAAVHCATKGIILEWVFAAGFSLVQNGRNWLNAEFLDRPEFTHLLWLDDDLNFAPGAIVTLLARNLDAVGGVYTTKHPTAAIFPYQAKGPVVDGLQEVLRLPGGFLLVSRRAAEAVAAACGNWYELEHDGKKRMSPHVFEVIVKDEKMWGEDFVYCERLMHAGFKVYVETNLPFGHIGRYSWNANLGRVLAEESAKGVEGEADPARWAKHEAAPKALAE